VDEINQILEHLYELAEQIYELAEQVINLFPFRLGGREKI
jgi:hypothetical protein